MKELLHVWGIRGIIFGLGSFTGAVFMWFYPSRKEWVAERRAKAEKKTDAQVLQVLGEIGNAMMNSRQIAESLKLDQEEVADSLERLEAKGRVKRNSGTYNNPVPSWFILDR